MKTLRIKQLALLSILFLIACQEDTPAIEDPQPVDDDMIAASLLADEYFKEQKGRTENNIFSITVLKYMNGQIYFNTNSDDIKEYQVVTETTITAYVEPGELVFWYRGSGLENLEGVDFDEDAQAFLNELPDEYFDLIWVLKVPDVYDPEHNELKYDIVYESEDNKGVVIRLDPKIKLGGRDDEADPGEGEAEGDGE